jgi:hypothetical protein
LISPRGVKSPGAPKKRRPRLDPSPRCPRLTFAGAA